MSAEASRDVSLINDEDTLRRMWQDTEDFGRKKEIRSHMYKLREARLKEFYNSGEVSSDIKKTSSSTTTTTKTCSNEPTHADSLADHSFISMKTKEIRDSESPTRDINYRTATDKTGANHGWNVVNSSKVSDDGKTYTTSRLATTSGTERIDGGKIDFAAKNEHKTSAYQDGDDKNFTKAVGSSSNTMIRQEAVGGDENSSFRSSSTKTSSSSKFVSEQRSTAEELKPATTRMITHHDIQGDDNLVSRKIYTNDAPADVRNHPGYVEGKTKVTRETRRLADGTTVTTTKYETKGATTAQSSKSSQQQQQQQISSSSTMKSSTSTTDQKHEKIPSGTTTITRTITNESHPRYIDDSKDTRSSSTVIRKTQETQEYQPQRTDDTRTTSSSTVTTKRTHETQEYQPQKIDDTTARTSSTTVTKRTHETYECQPQITSTIKTTATKQIQETDSYQPRQTDDSKSQKIVKTTVIRNIDDYQPQIVDDSRNTTTTTKTTVRKVYDTQEIPTDNTTSTTTTKTTVTKTINEPVEVTKVTTTKNIIDDKATTKKTTTDAPRAVPQDERAPLKQPETYETPERRQPIRPGPSEMDQRRQPTEGQYDTTYRADYTKKEITNKRISVDLSPTHEAFARSLRAVSPDRISSRGSLRTSTNSLRSSTSPEKNRHPTRYSPERRSTSPRKSIDRLTSNDTVTYKTRTSSTDTVTRKTKTTDIDSSTLTRKTKTNKPRSPSSSTTASDIEFIRNTDIITDLDTNETTVVRRDRPTKLDVTSPYGKKRTSPEKKSPSETKPRQLKRTDTYEERCRQILGITNETTTKRRGSTEKIIRRDSFKTKSPDKEPTRRYTTELPSPTKKSPIKTQDYLSPTKKSPERKQGPTIGEFPSQIRKSPVKETSPERRSPIKQRPKIADFSSPTRKSPDKISEFPSQIRKSPEKTPLEKYPAAKKSPTKEAPKINEFPSQIRKSPEKQPQEKYPERKSPSKEPSKISEFPSQIRRSPEREPLDQYPEKRRPDDKYSPSIEEFPSQVRKSPERISPERQLFGIYPEKTTSTTTDEFITKIRKDEIETGSTTIRKSPERERPRICEFPSQIRRSPEREPLEKYPEKERPTKEAPNICEFPSQIRKSPEKEPLETYPEKQKPLKEGSKIDEFPSQIRKSPEKQPFEKYPEKEKPRKEGPTICEFPSQIRKSPEKEPLEKYPGKQKPSKDDGPKIAEFPSQIRKSPEKEPLQKYPEKEKPTKEAPKIDEFPSQVRKSSEKQPFEKYPEQEKTKKTSPTTTCEFPSQIRKSPERGPVEPYPEKEKPSEYPSQTRKSPEKLRPIKGIPDVEPTRKSPEKGKKPKKQRTTTSSSESSTDEEEEEIEETVTITTVSELEGKVPVNEPLFTKKFMYKVGKDEEAQRTDMTKQTTRLDKEIVEIDEKTEKTKHKTVKKDLSRRPDLFLEEERKDTSITLSKTTPTKKPLTEKNTVVTTTKKTVTRDDSVKTRKIQDDKTRVKTTKTLYDVENVCDVEEQKGIHIKTQRIDDTVNKKINKVVNGDVTTKKTTVTKKPQPTKPETVQKTVTKTISTDIKKTQKVEPKRHVVTTTITVTPKTTSSTKPVSKTVTKTVTTKTTKITQPTGQKPKQPTKLLQNGHVSSDTENEEEIVSTKTTKHDNKKITRTTSDQIITKPRTPIRGFSKPELISSPAGATPKTPTTKPKQPEKKCVTTKSIVINNEIGEREVIVDLQRSTSSREPSPDKVCPMPVSSDDDSPTRYPDQIVEPEDGGGSLKRKPKKLSDIPILETDDVHEFTTRITEVIDNVNKVDETDESLLTVNKKISKFLDTTTEKMTKPQGPAPKVQRPKLQVDENLKSDECLLSVSEKVNKFISTAEQLTTPQLVDRPKSPKCQFYPEENVSVSDKVTHFIKTAEKVVQPQTSKSPPKPGYDVNDKSKDDECLLSVSDKVTKYKTTTEKLNKDTKKPVSLSKIDMIKPSSTQTTTECVQIETEEQTYTRKPSPPRGKTPPTTKKSEQYPRRDSSPKMPDSTPKSSRRPSEDETKTVLSSTGRLRSTESVKKAKALFENINKQEHQRQRDILSRPSVFEGRKLNQVNETKTVVRKLSYKDEDEDEKVLKSTRVITGKSRSKSPEDRRPESREQSPESDIPGYMRPLDRSLRPNSPHRESINQLTKKLITTSHSEEEIEGKSTKFGVTLRRTESGREPTTKTTTITMDKNITITEEEIEEIYDLEILEQLLEKVVGYDLRRKIRAQIRIVKKLISENKLPQGTTTTKKSKHITTANVQNVQSTEHKSSYSYSERKSSSSEVKTTTRRSQSPDTKPRKSPEKTQLKKVPTPSKSVPDDAPEWVKQRNLKKPSERVTSKTATTTATTTTTSKRLRSSPAKEVKGTDIITSSYGIGPTDDNGTPLFGLKALRAQNKTEKTKVQGTVITSQYYSENGKEPVGEISVTKYSNDPRDLGRNDDKLTKGISSITTTQKFGYKDTPSLKSLTSKKKGICDVSEETSTSRTTKTERRGSVKAMSQKFIENAVETTKNERQSSYPKAGLILRTSSFKTSTSSDASRESSPTTQSETVSIQTTTKTVGGETFLSNRSKVTGVKDVLTRMTAEDIREDDTVEDVEARGLLNKFLGAQVILSGIESSVKSSTSKTSSTSTSARSTTKVTTTVTEGGKPVTRTHTFTHPITDEELESIWDEQTLRLLLEQSTEYEERRRIRARLRQVMAEQEACIEMVENAGRDQSSGTLDGESQLLPLLQGLLEAPDTEQTADSGTESGEDQRNGLIIEVQSALDKLSTSLRSDAIEITPEKRSSLLQLVTKLQAGLAASTPAERRGSSSSSSTGQGRFSRRRSRPTRHTVGVSSEELADARRLIEEISLHDLTPSSSGVQQSAATLLQKQNSEGSVVHKPKPIFKPFTNQKTIVKNAIAKPFSSSNSSTVSGNSSSVQTPTEPSESLELLFAEEPNESIVEKPNKILSYRSISLDEQKLKKPLTATPLIDLGGNDVNFKSIQQAVQQAAANKILGENPDSGGKESETDEDSTVKAVPLHSQDEDEETTLATTQNNNNNNGIIMQNNPIYIEENQENHKNLKKYKLKRANTIDIPKPSDYYDDDDDDDSDNSLKEEDFNKRRRSNYLALRGPINLDIEKKTMPVFEPKTENDKKFLAFINKHNNNNNNNNESGAATKNSLWSKPTDNVWNNKFGNIKTTFEKATVAAPSASHNSARNFWKTTESTARAKAVQDKFEERNRQTKSAWGYASQNQVNDRNIVTGSLKVKTFEPEKNYKFTPQPLPVNKFSHAPQSAFKPIAKKAATPTTLHIEPIKQMFKTEVKDNKAHETPLYLYSPKPQDSPVKQPWTAGSGESRVLSLAASKFENTVPPPTEPMIAAIKPRRLSKDKVIVPSHIQQTPKEKLTAPYLVKTVEEKNSNNVRKMSDTFENNKNMDAYSTYTTVKYAPIQEQPPQTQYHQYPQQDVQGYYQPNKFSYQQGYHPQPQQKPHQSQQQSKYPTPNQDYLPENLSYTYTLPQQGLQYIPQDQYIPSAQQYLVGNQQYPPQNQYRPIPVQNQQYFVPSQQYSPQATQQYQYPVQNQQYPAQNQSYTQKCQDSRPQYDYASYTQPSQETQYTSTYQYKPQVQTPTSPQSISSPIQTRVIVEPPTPQPQELTGPPKLQSQMSCESIHEYNAVSSKVMTGPVSQQATTVRQKSPMSRDEHDMAAALNLRNSLQKVGSRSKETSPNNSGSSPSNLSGDLSPIQQKTVSPHSFSYKSTNDSKKIPVTSPISSKSFSYKKEADNCYNYNKTVMEAEKKPVPPPIQSFEVSDSGESIVSTKFQIPVINVPKVAAAAAAATPKLPSAVQVMNKAESWNQICMLQRPAHKPSPRASPNARTVLKSKSSHTLALPKQYEAGMSKDEMALKRKTMEMYLNTGSKSLTPSQVQTQNQTKSGGDAKVVKRSINRLKTSEKVATYRHSTIGLSRSRTLPDIACPELLDESNVEQAFDDLFKSSS